MRKWRVIIADDEPLARCGVRQLLEPHPQFRVVAECRDGKEVERALGRTAADVVILDIEMPSLSGLEVARRWSTHDSPALVFLTAHSVHALEAFESAAVDYLVKPVSAARFARTVARLTARLAERPLREPHSALLVSSGRGTVVLPLAEVEYLSSADHYARVWSGGRPYLLRESLDALEVRLEPEGFIRAHRGALVRVGAVQVLRRNAEGAMTLVLASGAKVPVSRRRVAAVADAIALRNRA